MGKKFKKIKRDEENILSKDIDMAEEIKNLERINDRSGVQREMSNINYSKSFIKSLKFKPQKYKGQFLPYHLRWIFGNSMKNNEISLVQEVKALETEIIRLKQMKLLNREFRKIAGLPYGITSKLCSCCKKMERSNHDCSHLYCEGEKCTKKKNEEIIKNNLLRDFRSHKRVFFKTVVDRSLIDNTIKEEIDEEEEISN